jgi:DNA-binding CsgD family transcriptional regulator
MDGLIDVVEAAYDVEQPEAAWLERLAAAVRRSLAGDGAALAVLLDVSQTPQALQLLAGSADGVSLETIASVIASAPSDADAVALFDRVNTGRSVGSVRAAFGAGFEDTPIYKNFFAPLGFADSLYVNARDPDGFACAISAVLRRPASESEVAIEVLERIEAHLASAYRLRRGVAKDASLDVDAILDTAGRILHAGAAAEPASRRAAIRAAAMAVERARGPLRRHDAEEALSIWRAMVAGEWTLVDRFETDGKRLLVARRNAPRPPEGGRLTPREYQVAALAALGYTNKRTCYALGLSPSTVSRHLRASCAKLGAKSRAEMVRLLWGSKGKKAGAE